MAYDLVLGPDEKRELLRIARASAAEFLRSGRLPPGKPHRRSLLADGAVFVALRERDRGTLRGCHGGFEAVHPLYRAVQESVVEAVTATAHATEDELDELIIEIAVLGPTCHIGSPDDLVLAHAPQSADEFSLQDGLALTWNHLHAFAVIEPHESGIDALRRLYRTTGIVADTEFPHPDVHIVRSTLQHFDDLRFPPLDPQQIIAQMIGHSST